MLTKALPTGAKSAKHLQPLLQFKMHLAGLFCYLENNFIFAEYLII
jgi:hypothetical protein